MTPAQQAAIERVRLEAAHAGTGEQLSADLTILLDMLAERTRERDDLAQGIQKMQAIHRDEQDQWKAQRQSAEASLQEALESVRDLAAQPCSTAGLEDLEPGCCPQCRAREVHARLTKKGAGS